MGKYRIGDFSGIFPPTCVARARLESAHAGASIDAGSVMDHRSRDVQSETLP